MDGLLLDTEDIYTHCNNIICHQYGRPNLPWKVKCQMQGRPGPEVCLPSPSNQKPRLTYSTGERDISRLGPTSSRAINIHRHASGAASKIFSNDKTLARCSTSAKTAPLFRCSPRPCHIVTRSEFQAQVNVQHGSLLCFPREESRLGR